MATIHRHHARCGGGSLHASAQGRPFAFTTSPRQYERDRPFKVEHLSLDVALDLPARSVDGAATLELSRVDAEARHVELDAVGFVLRGVEVDGKSVDYIYDGARLRVPVEPGVARAKVRVDYRATPRRGMYFLEPDEHVPARPRQVWTQCQEEDARHFVPCHDKPHVKMTTDVRVTVPAGMWVLSNGELVERLERGDVTTFQWAMRQPHPSYLLTIVAGAFERVESTARRLPAEGEVPLEYLYPEGKTDEAKRAFERTPKMIEHFGKLLGVAYPWNKYAQVVVSDFIFGGMENTTATTLYEHVLLDAKAAVDVTSDDLVAHELAHQWFGDYVTCRDWSDGWLNEGFATYFEHVWREADLGVDELEYGLRVDLASYLSEASGRYRRPVICQDYDAPLDLFDRHLYEKGSLVLHALRVELGSETFWRGVRLYLERHAGGIVETRDLMRALEEVSGRSLGRRFEELLMRPGHPELDVSLSWDKGVLSCAVRQTQSTSDNVPSAFEVPLTLMIQGRDGATREERLRVTMRSETFAVPCAERPSFVVVDPHMQIVGSVSVRAPGDALRAQLTDAPTARGRWLAAQALARTDDAPTIEALARCLGDDAEFWGTRVEAASALGKIRARECFDALSRHVTTAHPKVRRAVVDALGAFKTQAAVDVLKPRALRDDSYLVEAEAARALGRTRQASAFDTLLDVVDRRSWAEVVAAGAIDGLAALRDERALPHLYARSRYGHPTRVRRAAALAVPKLAADRPAREHLEDMLDDNDPILRIDVVRALSDMSDARSRSALKRRLDVDLDARVRRRIREVLRDLGDKKAQSDAQRDDVDKLQGELAELKARLVKLEARLSDEPPSTPKARKAAKASKAKASATAAARRSPEKKAGPRSRKKPQKRR